MFKKLSFRNIFLVSIFLLIPSIYISFSNSISFYGVQIYGYERTKVLFFEVLIMAFSLFEVLTYFFKKENKPSGKSLLPKYFYLVLVIFIILSFVFSFNKQIALFGNFEKPHGMFYYLSIFLFGRFLLNNFSEKLQKYIFYTLVYILYFFFIYGVYEFLTNYGNNGIFHTNSYRIITTLGNSNYVSGFVILIQPLTQYFLRKNIGVKITTILLSTITIVSTQSIIGITLFLVYFGYKLFESNKIKYKYIYLIIILLIVCGLIYYSFGIKSGSFDTRLILWRETFNLIINSPKSFLCGYGGDNYGVVIEAVRSGNLNNYVSPSIFIDSPHNILLDIIFSYGAPIFALVGYFIYKLFSIKGDSWQKEIIILFIISFSFNIPVLSHFLVLVFAVVSLRNGTLMPLRQGERLK